MFGAIGSFLVGMFSHSKIQDTAIDAVRKLGGLDDLNHKEKAQFLLDYIQHTKHQSPVRRLIALVLTSLYAMVIIIWLVSGFVGYAWNFDSMINYAGTVKMFMESVIVQPFNIILAFYFVTNIASRIGNK